MAKWNIRRVAVWAAFAFIVVGCCLALGCRTDGSFAPISEWFVTQPDGSTPYETATGPAKEAAPIFGPIGQAVAAVIGSVGLLGGAVTGAVARRKGKQVRAIGPAFQKTVHGIQVFKSEHPEAAKALLTILDDILYAEDDVVVDHFRTDTDVDLRLLKGVAS